MATRRGIIALPFAAAALVLPRRALLVQGGGATFSLLARPAATLAEEEPERNDQPLILGADGQTLDPNASSETTFQTIRRGGASVRALSEWKYGADGGMTAPVIGQTASAVTFSANPTPLRAMSDLGKPEQARCSLAAMRSRSTSARPRARRCSSCARSRSMRISTAPTWSPHPAESTSRVPRYHAGIWPWDRVVEARPSRAGVEFYEYTLALPARKCNAELATACLPERVELISAAVGGGTIHVLEVSATAAQWAQAGEALKRLRSSFALVGSSDSPPESP